MRLAIQISGEFRVLHLCLPKLQEHVLNVFPNTEVDIFFHTWRCEEDFDNKSDKPVYGHGSGIYRLQPRSYKLDKFEECTHLHSLPRCYSMFYSIKQANTVRKDYEALLEVKYDLVMRYRTDCILNEDLFEAVKPFLLERKSFLCIPKPIQPVAPDGPVENDSQGLCDWMAIGTPDAMDIYCSTYDTWVSEGLPLVPETMLALQLQLHGISKQTILKRPDYDMYLVDGSGAIRGV
jgi:hypothetical protein